MESDKIWPHLVAPTVALVIAVFAFFKETILDWLLPPEISISVDPVEPIPDLSRSPSRELYWQRLCVTNNGRRAAKNLQVFMAHLLKQMPDGNFVPVQRFPPMCLRWSHFNPPRITVDLMRGLSRRVDLLMIAEPESVYASRSISEASTPPMLDDCEMTFQTEVTPSSYSNVVDAGAYEVRLLIAGDNYGPKSHGVRITFDGTWAASSCDFTLQHFSAQKL